MSRRMEGGGPGDERPLSELFSEMTNEVKELISKEVELAKVETKEQFSKAAKAGGMLSAGGVLALFAALLLSFAAAWGLAAVIPTGFAFLAVGLVYLGVAAVLFKQGRARLADARPVPEQTLKTLKDDVKVAKDALSRGASDTPWRTTEPPWRRS
ncbi:MAG: phage holin family protein [Actinomycetota bacterium]|nr:phage holin family protein [Actinomycetota bacterium]